MNPGIAAMPVNRGFYNLLIMIGIQFGMKIVDIGKGLKMNTIEDYWDSLLARGYTREEIDGGFYYRLPESLGTGGFTLLGDPSLCCLSMTDMTFHKPYVFYEGVREKTIEFSQYLQGDVSFYQNRNQIYPIDYGLNYWVNAVPLYGYKRIEAGQRLAFSGGFYRERFFDTLPFQLPADFWETAAAVLNPDVIALPAVTQICGQIENCCLKGNELLLFIKAKGLEAFALTLDYINLQNPKPGISHADRTALEKIREFLENNYVDPPGLDQLARTAGMNQHKMMALFKRLNGTTVYGYIKRLRMEQAAVLLKDSSLSVAAIAEQVGYHGDGHFQQSFRQIYGTTPVKFRTAIRT